MNWNRVLDVSWNLKISFFSKSDKHLDSILRCVNCVMKKSSVLLKTPVQFQTNWIANLTSDMSFHVRHIVKLDFFLPFFVYVDVYHLSHWCVKLIATHLRIYESVIFSERRNSFSINRCNTMQTEFTVSLSENDETNKCSPCKYLRVRFSESCLFASDFETMRCYFCNHSSECVYVFHA